MSRVSVCLRLFTSSVPPVTSKSAMINNHPIKATYYLLLLLNIFMAPSHHDLHLTYLKTRFIYEYSLESNKIALGARYKEQRKILTGTYPR